MERKDKLKNNLFFIGALCFLLQGAFAFSAADKTWKVLIYMQADNNLAPYAFWDIAEIERGLVKNSNTRVFTELDLPGDEGSFRLEIHPNLDSKEMSLEYFKNVNLSDFNTTLISIENESVDQAKKLKSFIEWAQKSNPTDYTLLVIWGHGEGWGQGTITQFGGVAIDDNPKSKLSINEVTMAVQSLNQKIDFLSMDACLMQTIEVASEFSGLVDYVSGSTQIQNFRGLPYTKILDLLGHSAPYDLAIKLSQTYINELSEYATEQDKNVATISVVNTHELKNIFLYEFNKSFLELSELLKNRFDYKLTLSEMLKNSPAFLGSSRDLYNFISIIQKFLKQQNEVQLNEQFNKTLSYLSLSIVSYGYGDNYVLSHEYILGSFKAFGIWFPSSRKEYNDKISSFEQSSFYGLGKGWGFFLVEIFGPSIPFPPLSIGNY